MAKYNENHIYITRDGAMGWPITLNEGRQVFLEMYSTEGEWPAEQYAPEDYFDTGVGYSDFEANPKRYEEKAREYFKTH